MARRLGAARVSPWRSHEEDDAIEKENKTKIETIFQIRPFLSRKIRFYTSIVGMLSVYSAVYGSIVLYFAVFPLSCNGSKNAARMQFNSSFLFLRE